MRGAQMATEDVYAVALNVMSAAAEAPSRDDAMLDAHRVVSEFDEAALRRIAVCIATEIAWSQLPRVFGQSLPGSYRSAGQLEANWRPALQQWIDRLRLEVAWHAPDRPATDQCADEEATA